MPRSTEMPIHQPTRTRRAALWTLVLTTVAGSWACTDSDGNTITDPETIFQMLGSVVLDGGPLQGATIYAFDGADPTTTTTDANGEFAIRLEAGTYEVSVLNAGALCQYAEVQGSADQRIDLRCTRPNGPMDIEFRYVRDDCDFGPFDPRRLTYEVTTILEADGSARLSFQTEGGLPIVGSYDEMAREFSGSSESFTDENGITVREDFRAELEAAADQLEASLRGEATAVLESEAGACSVTADLNAFLTF